MFKRLLKKLKRDNRGSAIVVVIVAVSFIVVLGSILLYLSLVNFQMKTLDRTGKKTFYDAESVMNEVRAQVQGVVSDAINEAYTDVLNVFNEYSDDEREAEFQDLFYEQLYATAVGEGQDARPLFVSEDTQYDPQQLAALLGEVDNATLSGSGRVFKSPDSTYITLQDVKVVYKTSKGFYTTVTADIKIATPEFESASSTVTQSYLPDFTIIADGELNQTDSLDSALTVTGNAYAGSVDISQNGYTLTIENAANFVSAGDITVDDSAVLSVLSGCAVWAGGILVEDGGTFTSEGETYVANDLNLLGRNTKAVLTYEYFGFGSDPSNPDQSSSIIVNGINTVLDLSGIQTLVLAGHSFVDYGSQTENGQYVMMGQSVAVKSDQLAYLVPENFLSVSNPFSYTSDYEGGTYNEDFADFVTLDETLESYGIDDPLEDILYMRKQVGETNLVYFCFKFEDGDLANEYFKDYFTEHSDSIQKYLNIYCQEYYPLADAASLGLAGDAYSYIDDSQETLELIQATGVSDTTLEHIENSFNNLCVTLSRTDDGDGAAVSPYNYYVDTTALKGLDTTREYSHEGVVKAIVCDGDYDISGLADSVHIVIASGNVTVYRDFTGLIIAGGNVTLKADVTADRAAVADALQALSNDDDKEGIYEYYFLNPEHIAPLSSSAGQTGDSAWDMNELVSYENWTKNED